MYDAIVVGLGAAGAMACRVFDRCERRILALEAGPCVGGRVRTEEFGDSLIELGAEWIHGTAENTVYDFAMTFKFDLKSQELRHMVFSSNGDVENPNMLQDLWEYSFKVVTNPPNKAQPLGQYLTEKIKEYAAANMPELEHDKTGYMVKFLRWMNLVIRNHESCDNWNDVSTQSDYKDLEGSPYVSWHKLGYRTLFHYIFNLENMNYVEAKFNTEVVQIRMPDEPEGPVTVTCRDGSVYHARSVLVTVSLGVLKERHETLFEPRLPDEKVRAIEHLSIGVVNKVALLFEKSWWPSDVSCLAFLWRPEELEEIPETDMWITKVFGASMTMGNDNCLVFWVSGQEAKLIENICDDEVREKLMWILRKFAGNLFMIPEPIAMKRSAWYSNPFTRGSYSFDNINTPNFPEARSVLAEPITDARGMSTSITSNSKTNSWQKRDGLRILFAGEATDKTHFSTVHGAIDSGCREAFRFIRFDGPDINDPEPKIAAIG